MTNKIPNSVIGAVTSVLAEYYNSHSTLNSRLLESRVPGGVSGQSDPEPNDIQDRYRDFPFVRSIWPCTTTKTFLWMRPERSRGV